MFGYSFLCAHFAIRFMAFLVRRRIVSKIFLVCGHVLHGLHSVFKMNGAALVSWKAEDPLWWGLGLILLLASIREVIHLAHVVWHALSGKWAQFKSRFP